MKQISIGDAFREFTKWSNASRVGLVFGRHDAGVNFTLRRATLDVQEPGLLVEVKGTSIATLHFGRPSTALFELTADDVKREYSRLGEITPSFESCIGAKFGNGDFCFLFPDK